MIGKAFRAAHLPANADCQNFLFDPSPLLLIAFNGFNKEEDVEVIGSRRRRKGFSTLEFAPTPSTVVCDSSEQLLFCLLSSLLGDASDSQQEYWWWH